MEKLEPATDRFREEFKRYKKRDADLSDVIDLTRSKQYGEKIRHCPVTGGSSSQAAELGLTPPSQWEIYSLTSTPGLKLIPDPFVEGCQHRWVRRCLVDFPCKPNICNLDAHVTREGEGRLWPKEDQGRSLEESVLYKLRWVTLGYHYDWNTKEYYDDQRSPFPTDLAQLSSFILDTAGFPGFSAEAAIVNFYHLDSTLSGHTDHSERDLSLPLLSISFGQPAVFLIGGETKSVRPQAIMLRSGDIVIMSGPSRVVFHGVPKIISPSASSPVPRTLGRRALLDCMHRSSLQGKQVVSVCSVCGIERRWSSSATEATSKEVNSTNEGIPALGAVSPLKNVEEMKAASVVAEHSRGRTDLSVSQAKRPKREQRASRSIVTVGGMCVYCAELARCWPDFESYLSMSRINVNIRQVNSHDIV